MNEKIKGVTHPVPGIYAQRIYDGKTVYIGKRYLSRVNEGDKFILYESHGSGAYTGWADIVGIEKLSYKEIIKKYEDKIMLTDEELREYSRGTKKLNVIVFDNFEKFENMVRPSKFVTMGGKYILEKEYKSILKRK